ncbi:MAG: VCBS repeat-containing protein [Pseudomonadota bacterium]
MTDLLFGDVNQDVAADAVVLNYSGVYVRRGSKVNQEFDPIQRWTEDPYYGGQNLLADADGDGSADAIVVNWDGVWVRRSSGSEFAPETRWTEPTNDPTVDAPDGFFAANVDGEPGVDLVAFERRSILVRKTRGNSFDSIKAWATGLNENAELRLADVTGDGLADAILIESSGLQVLPSTGDKFAEGTTWSTLKRPGAPGWFFADVDGDGKADAVALDASGSRVFVSDGLRFATKAGAFERVIPLGQRGNQFADVNGDGHLDAIVEDDWKITVYPAILDDFGTPQTWSSDALQGGGP